MDQDRLKIESPSGNSGDKTATEHNYTTSNDEGMLTITRLAPDTSTSRSTTVNYRQIAPKPPSYTPPTYQPGPKVIKKDVFNRIRRSEAELGKAAEMVRGGMTFQTASDTFNIPISTIRFYMARRGILPQRRRGRGSAGVRDDDLMHPPFEIIHYRLPDIDKPL